MPDSARGARHRTNTEKLLLNLIKILVPNVAFRLTETPQALPTGRGIGKYYFSIILKLLSNPLKFIKNPIKIH